MSISTVASSRANSKMPARGLPAPYAIWLLVPAMLIAPGTLVGGSVRRKLRLGMMGAVVVLLVILLMSCSGVSNGGGGGGGTGKPVT